MNTELPLLRNSKRKAESSAKGKFLGFFVAIMFSFVVFVFSDAFLHCVFVVFLVCMLVLCCAASFTSVRVFDLMLAVVFLRVYCQSDVFDSVFWVCCVTGVVLTVLSVFADSLFCVTGVVLVLDRLFVICLSFWYVIVFCSSCFRASICFGSFFLC